MNSSKPNLPKSNLAVSLPSAQSTGRGNFESFGKSKVSPTTLKQTVALSGVSDPAPSPNSPPASNTQTMFP